MQFETIRRRTDGSIDYNFYHRRATALRAKAMTGSLPGGARVMTVGLIVAALILAPLIVAHPGLHAVSSNSATATSVVAQTR
jgi:hypothetical protein